MFKRWKLCVFFFQIKTTRIQIDSIDIEMGKEVPETQFYYYFFVPLLWINVLNVHWTINIIVTLILRATIEIREDSCMCVMCMYIIICGWCVKTAMSLLLSLLWDFQQQQHLKLQFESFSFRYSPHTKFKASTNRTIQQRRICEWQFAWTN